MVNPRVSTKTMTAELPTLPALKHPGDPASFRPVIVIDTREQDPLPIRRLDTIRAGLYSGDYSIKGMEPLFAVERKSIGDLVACCTNANRERFEHELHRLRGYRFKRLLIVGNKSDVDAGNYRSKVKPASVMGTLNAFECRYDIPVVWTPTPDAGAHQVEMWVLYFTRETVKTCNAILKS